MPDRTEPHGIRRADAVAGLPRIVDRLITAFDRERTCWVILGLAMLASAVLGLWLTRGVTFHADDFLYFIENRGIDLRVLLGPHNGHLIFVPRLMYAIGLSVFGPRHYVVFRLLEVIGIALAAGLFFVLAKRKIGAPWALAPSLALLFLGSSWQDSLDPVGIAHVYCIAAGFAALVALDHATRRADLAACALLTLSVATFSVGLAFLVGIAVSVLLGPDRRRRAWIFLLPLALYLAWFLAPELSAPPFSAGTGAHLSNVLLIPAYAANAAAAVAAAVTGLSYNFNDPASYTIDSPWGYVIAALAIALLMLRARRGDAPVSLWSSVAILLSFWISGALVTHFTSEPNQIRYVYDGVALALLIGVDALQGVRRPRAGLIWLYAATVLALAGNIALLRAGSGALRGIGASDRAQLAAVEIARDHVSPHFVPLGEPALAFLDGIAGGAQPYLRAVAQNGSYAFTLPELRRQAESVRQLADSTLASALGLNVTPTSASEPGSGCTTHPNPAGVGVRPPGVLLRSPVPQTITLRRFAGVATARVGVLSPGTLELLRIPGDRALDPWYLSTAGGPLTVCALAR